MGDLVIQGELPPPRSRKWQIVVGGEKITVGPEAVPSTRPKNGGVMSFIRATEKIAKKYPNAFIDEPEDTP